MAAGDLTDLATCYVTCNIDAPKPVTDTILATLISAISAYLPQVLNVNILSASYVEYYDGNGKDELLLRQRPVTAISSIAWNGETTTAAGDLILGTSGIVTDGRKAILVNKSFPYGQRVKIAYTAGYATVPLDIKLAVAELVAEEYARRTHVGETTRSQGGQVSISFDQKVMHAAIKSRLMNYAFGAPI